MVTDSTDCVVITIKSIKQVGEICSSHFPTDTAQADLCVMWRLGVRARAHQRALYLLQLVKARWSRSRVASRLLI